MTTENKKGMDFLLLRKVMEMAKPYRSTWITTAILALVMAPLGPLRTNLVQEMVDKYIVETSDIPALTKMIALVGLLLLIEACVQYAFTMMSSWLGQAVIKDLRVRVFTHITSLRLKYFDTNPIGTSTTRTISDLETINSVFSQGIITILADFLTLILVLAFMLNSSWKLTLVCLIVVPFLIWASFIFKEKVKTTFEQVRTQVAKMNAFFARKNIWNENYPDF